MYSTGNEYVSLPEIERNGFISSFNVLSMDTRGMIEFRSKNDSFMSFSIIVDGLIISSSEYSFSLDRYWIPELSAKCDNLLIKVKLLCPIGYKGFLYWIQFSNQGDTEKKIEIRFDGNWEETLHTVNESKVFEGSQNVYKTGWSDAICFDIRAGFPIMAFAPDTSKKSIWTTNITDSISWSCTSSFSIGGGKNDDWGLVWGIGFEEVAAVTAGREMLRHGMNELYEETCAYLDNII